MTKILPLAYEKEIELPLPAPDDKRADMERLTDSSSSSIPHLKVPFRFMKALPSLLRENGFKVKPVFGIGGDSHRLLALETDALFGIAIDIGTTNIAASLFDLRGRSKAGECRILNPQVSKSSDILGRMHLVMSEGVEELHEMLLEGLNRLVREITIEAGIRPDDLYAVSIAANTVMTHLLLGLDTSNIPIDPYIPVIHSPGFFSAGEIGLGVNPEATVYIFPNAGSYVGGDIIAGILSAGIYTSENPSILIDAGTNAEIVIGTKDWLIVGAGAAGPALEEGIFRSGKRADRGVIYRADVDPETLRVNYKTVGDTDPAGICGSGVIDLVAELHDKGIINNLGRFRDGKAVVQSDGEAFFPVAQTSDGMLGITEREISNFLRTKAAMHTSLHVLMNSVGLDYGDIERVSIAGALGSGVRVQKAIKVGMLPNIPVEKYHALGNTSLAGAELLLNNGLIYREAEKVRSMITYREINSDTLFMQEFPDALSIPDLKA